MNAAIITIGDEILIGQVVDTNSAWLGENLKSRGIAIRKIISVGDGIEDIKRAIAMGFECASLVLVTGGLGPTKDDITKTAICEYFNTGLKFDQRTYDRIARLFERWKRRMTPAHEAQCYMPEIANLLKNSMGTAPGMWIEHNDKILLSMPGVPYEMKAIMSEGGIDKILKYFKPSTILKHVTIRTVGEGEARLSHQIEDLIEQFRPGMSIAFLPGLGQVRLRISHTGTDENTVEEELQFHVQKITERLEDFVYTLGEKSLEEVLGDLCIDNKLSLATAESCTGGFLSHKITSIAGSSEYFKGAIVSYSNEMKNEILGVKNKTLEQFGAVSKETVLEMHRGLLEKTKADIGISISGIAGPGGGTKEKPVGTIHFAWGNKANVQHSELLLGKDRLKNIELASVYGLNVLRKFILAQ